MPATGTLTLGKKERIAGKRLVETLFKGGVSRSMSCYPLRAVYALVPMADDGSSAKMMVSVPKRHFKRAVKRNRVKRQVREAFRLHKAKLSTLLAGRDDQCLTIAFIWLDSKLHSTATVDSRVAGLMERIREKL